MMRVRFLREDSGAVSVIAAISIMVLLAIAAMVVDAGAHYYARRNLQAINDAAALAAVQNPANAAAIAAAIFSGNGYVGQSMTVTVGTYTPDESITAENRFKASASAINAVRIRASLVQKRYFAAIFGLGSNTALVTQSTAARVPTTSFGAGTRLASLNAGLINQVLGQLWGSSVSLSLIDYQALVNSDIDALPFFNQLATDVGVGGSYQQLANASVTSSQLLTALVETVTAAGAHGNSSGSLLALKSLQAQLGNSAAISLSNVIDLTPLYGRKIGNIDAVGEGSLRLNLMSFLSATARTVGGGHLIDAGAAFSIPVTGSTVSTHLTVGSPFAQNAVATVGSTIRTAQVRMALLARLASVNLGVATATVQVPIYLEAASGQATIMSMPCVPSGNRVEIAATSGATSLQFGTVTDAALQNFAVAVTPVAAPVASVTLLGIPVQIGIAGVTNVASSGPATLDFTQADIDSGTIKSLPGTAPAPFSLLSTNFTLSANVAGNPLLNGLIASLSAALKPLVASLIAPLDAPVDQLMNSLGLALGVIDVRVFDVSCRTPTLVG